MAPKKGQNATKKKQETQAQAKKKPESKAKKSKRVAGNEFDLNSPQNATIQIGDKADNLQEVEKGVLLDTYEITPTEWKAAARSLKRKCQFLDPDDVDQCKNDRGDMLLEAVAREQKARKAVNGYITPEWWQQKLKEYNLESHPFEGLPVPDATEEDQNIEDDQMGEMVWAAVGDNPVIRWNGVQLLEKRLEMSPRLPLYQVASYLLHTQEGETVNRTMSMRLHMAMLKHMAEWDVPAQWAEGWAIAKPRMQQVVIWLWCCVSGTVPRDIFISKYSKVVRLFLPGAELKIVTDAIEAEKEPPLAALNAVLAIELGSKLFAKEQHAARWKDFTTQASLLIKGLMDGECAFARDDVANMKRRLQQATSELIKVGQCALQKGPYKTGWLSYAVELPVAHIDDFWKIPYYVARVHCSLNSKQSVRMPWEELLLGDEKIPNYPETVKVSENEVEDVRGSRKCMLPHVRGLVTLKDWIRAAEDHCEAIEKINSMWPVDVYFLKHYAADAIMKKLHGAMLEQFPQPDATNLEDACNAAKQHVSDVMEAITRLKASPLAMALEDASAKELQWLYGFLTSVLEYTAPNQSGMRSYPEFRMRCVERVESLLCLAVQVPHPDAAKNPLKAALGQKLTKRLQGKAAMSFMVEEFITKYEPLTAIVSGSVSDTQIFRMFPWMVPADKKELVENLIGKLSQNKAKQKVSVLNAVEDKAAGASTPKKNHVNAIDKQLALVTCMGPAKASPSSSGAASSGSNPKALASSARKESILRMYAARGKLA